MFINFNIIIKLSEHEFYELCGYKTPNQETQKSSKENIE